MRIVITRQRARVRNVMTCSLRYARNIDIAKQTIIAHFFALISCMNTLGVGCQNSQLTLAALWDGGVVGFLFCLLFKNRLLSRQCTTTHAVSTRIVGVSYGSSMDVNAVAYSRLSSTVPHVSVR